MALSAHLPLWLRRLLVDGSNVLGIHDGIEVTFTELKADADARDADSSLAAAGTDGLNRWGIDLAEPRLPGQTDDQYRLVLQAIKQGDEVNVDGLTFALAKYQLTARLVDQGDDDCFADLAFADVEAATIGTPTTLAVFYDPWDAGTIPDVNDFNQRCLNSAIDLFRVKAKGVQLIPFFPPTVTP